MENNSNAGEQMCFCRCNPDRSSRRPGERRKRRCVYPQNYSLETRDNGINRAYVWDNSLSKE